MRCQIRQSSINGCERTRLGADPGLQSLAPMSSLTFATGAAKARDTAQGPPRRAGVVPLPRARSAQREGGRRKAPQGDEPSYAALSQYPALNGLLMRNARGDTSTSLSVGIFSSGSAAISIRWTLGASLASFARSAWLLDAERATEKNRNTGREFSGHSSSPPRRGRCPAAARALPCQTWRS